MQTATESARGLPEDNGLRFRRGRASRLPAEVQVTLLTGGSDRHYAFGLAMALLSKGVRLDLVGSDAVDSPEMHGTPKLNFLNLLGDYPAGAGLLRKASKVLTYYGRLAAYVWTARPRVIHILWNGKLEFLDRTLLMLYYKIRGKKIVLTAHNVNEARRDKSDSFLNRFTLRFQYRLTDHIFVHTEKMKNELLKDYGVPEQATTVIPFGINNAVPDTALTPAEAKQRLGIGDGEKTILFFGYIRPSKGLEFLLAAFERIIRRGEHYRLVIAGRRTRGSDKYWHGIQQAIRALPNGGGVILRDEHIPDAEVELYFKAADVLVLPYTEIFQSGILFLGYRFGLPVIATDVGSFREDIIEGKTGFLCKPRDSADLARAIQTYFESDLFKCLDTQRQEIRDYAETHNSWGIVGEMTRNVYAALSRNGRA